MTRTLPVNNSKFAMKDSTGKQNWFVFDIETDGLYDTVTEIYCIVLHDINKNQTFTYGVDCIVNGLEHLARADVLIGHNILFYDIPVIKKLYPSYSFIKSRIIDTLISTRVIWPKEKLYDLDCEKFIKVPLKLRGTFKLEAWGYRLSNYKIEFKDFSAYSETMLEYCIQDVNVTTTLFNVLQQQNYPESSLLLEHLFAIAIQKQIQSGFDFDVDACLDLVDQLKDKQYKLEQELKIIFPPIEHKDVFIPKVNNKARGYVKGVPFEKIRLEEFNPGSRQQIDRKSTRLNSSHVSESRMPSSA